MVGSCWGTQSLSAAGGNQPQAVRRGCFASDEEGKGGSARASDLEKQTDIET